jgi:biopolymer transport protein ExbD
MPLRTESLDEPSLNLTPMIDIVFLLIIFFMVGTPVFRNRTEV